MRRETFKVIDIKLSFSQFKSADCFNRVDDNHILDLYIGLDNMYRYTLFLVSETKPEKIFSSQLINVQVGIRRDNKWGISFSLVDNQSEDIFFHFCLDIIESSRSLSSKYIGAKYVCNRYKKWQSMLTKYNDGMLSFSEIKGLIGELLFLKNFMIPEYGQEVAVNSWVGPENADQDFICNKTWYEIKSTVSGSESVRISSIEQLDMIDEGELIIVYLDKTSNSDDFKITINSIIKEICDSLKSEQLKRKLNDILLNHGYYYRNEYDEYLFKLGKFDRYKVDKHFPCIRKSMLPFSVINLRYELSISFISKYLLE